MPSNSTTVIGAGISGIACARVLADAGLPVQVLDRGHRVGGRMASRTLHDRPVDLGASYLTASPDSPFAGVVAGWVERGLARPWTDTFAVAGPGGLRETKTGPLRYGAAGGLRTLVADLATGLDVRQRRTVSLVEPGPLVDGDACGTAVLALPDPQARRVLRADSPADRVLDARGWQATLAVVLGFDSRRWAADLHGAFVHDSPVLDWVADDGDRRGDGAPVLVAHTTPAFSDDHLDHPDAAAPTVVAAVRDVLGIDADPSWTFVHRWTFAKPVDPRPSPFHLAGGIGLCGDGWSAPSKVQSAWASGHQLGTEIVRQTGA